MSDAIGWTIAIFFLAGLACAAADNVGGAIFFGLLLHAIFTEPKPSTP